MVIGIMDPDPYRDTSKTCLGRGIALVPVLLVIKLIIPSHIITSSSAITEGPHDDLIQLKSCQLLHNCTKITFD